MWGFRRTAWAVVLVGFQIYVASYSEAMTLSRSGNPAERVNTIDPKPLDWSLTCKGHKADTNWLDKLRGEARVVRTPRSKPKYVQRLAGFIDSERIVKDVNENRWMGASFANTFLVDSEANIGLLNSQNLPRPDGQTPLVRGISPMTHLQFLGDRSQLNLIRAIVSAISWAHSCRGRLSKISNGVSKGNGKRLCFDSPDLMNVNFGYCEPWPSISESIFSIESVGRLSDCDGSLHVARLSSGSLAKQPKLLLARFPERIGGEPQADGGYGQDNSEAPNHAFVVVLKEGIDTFENERRSRVEGGAVFFIIMIGGLLTVLWLYQAKR
jgi:hypothetical protein